MLKLRKLIVCAGKARPAGGCRSTPNEGTARSAGGRFIAAVSIPFRTMCAGGCAHALEPMNGGQTACGVARSWLPGAAEAGAGAGGVCRGALGCRRGGWLWEGGREETAATVCVRGGVSRVRCAGGCHSGASGNVRMCTHAPSTMAIFRHRGLQFRRFICFIRFERRICAKIFRASIMGSVMLSMCSPLSYRLIWM